LTGRERERIGSEVCPFGRVSSDRTRLTRFQAKSDCTPDSTYIRAAAFALCGHTHKYIPRGSKIKYGTLLRKMQCSATCKPARTLSPVDIGLGAIEKDEDDVSDKTPSLKHPSGPLLANRLRRPRTIFSSSNSSLLSFIAYLARKTRLCATMRLYSKVVHSNPPLHRCAFRV
jgi:hypothetical protein